MHAQAVNTVLFILHLCPFGVTCTIVHAYTTRPIQSSGVCNNKLFASESVSQTLSGKRERESGLIISLHDLCFHTPSTIGT